MMKFSQLQRDVFCKASHDRNPLHLDAEYARRTQFGRPVVYGMAAVLYGLGEWAKGRSFRLKSLRAMFRKPLFEGEVYDLSISETGKGISIRFRRGSVDYCMVSLNAEILELLDTERSELASAFEPSKEAAKQPQTAAAEIDYAMQSGVWNELTEAFKIGRNSMPTQQLATLLWASYYVGMTLPGRQALFSELHVSFASVDVHVETVQLKLEAPGFDERFNRFTVQGSGPGIDNLRIAAFQRPQPVDFPLSAMPRLEGNLLPLAGKVVFISGATRGFGAAMARLCALAGARLALNYRGDRVAAEALLGELRAHGSDADIFPADMAEPIAVAQIVEEISRSLGQIDLIVNNAAPPIRELQFGEQSNEEMLRYFDQNLSIMLETARQLIPLLAREGQFLHISTRFLVEPVRGFSHYLAAKAAQEALIQGLALEYRSQSFLVARLPRMLTDQTNLPFDFNRPRHPGEVAKEVILALIDRSTTNNFRVINLFGTDGSA